MAWSTHNRLLLLPALFLFLLPSWTVAEMLTGTVGNVDEEQRQFHLLVEDQQGRAEIAPDSVLISYQKNTTYPVLHQSIFPGCVRSGEKVRVWGEFAGDEKKHFLAIDIRGTGMWKKNDPTGVRQRLRACRKDGIDIKAVQSVPGKGLGHGGNNGGNGGGNR